LLVLDVVVAKKADGIMQWVFRCSLFSSNDNLTKTVPLLADYTLNGPWPA
jgi:hypothetical protein